MYNKLELSICPLDLFKPDQTTKESPNCADITSGLCEIYNDQISSLVELCDRLSPMELQLPGFSSLNDLAQGLVLQLAKLGFNWKLQISQANNAIKELTGSDYTNIISALNSFVAKYENLDELIRLFKEMVNPTLVIVPKGTKLRDFNEILSANGAPLTIDPKYAMTVRPHDTINFVDSKADLLDPTTGRIKTGVPPESNSITIGKMCELMDENGMGIDATTFAMYIAIQIGKSPASKELFCRKNVLSGETLDCYPKNYDRAYVYYDIDTGGFVFGHCQAAYYMTDQVARLAI